MAPAVQNLISGYILWLRGTGLFMAYNHQVDCMKILSVEHLNTHLLRAEGVNVCQTDTDRAETRWCQLPIRGGSFPHVNRTFAHYY